jgi:hypothetical protein
MTWITCPGCGLKHSPRPDGLCPRCHVQTGAPGSAPPPSDPAFARPDFPRRDFDRTSPSAAAPSPSQQPLPTTAVGGPPPFTSAPASTRATGEITAGSLVSRTLSTWWAHAGKFTALLVIAYVPLLLGAVAAGASAARGGLRGGAPAGFAGVLIVGLVVTLVLMMVQFGGVTYATLQHLAGRSVSFGAMFGIGWRRAWPLFVAGVLSTLLVWVGLFALIVPGVIAALGLVVALPVVVAENAGATDAMKRSFALTKGSRGTIFGALFLLGVVMILASVAGNVVNAIATAMGPLGIPLVLLVLLVQIGLSALSTVLCAVAYHDLRTAKEGADTTALASVFE